MSGFIKRRVEDLKTLLRRRKADRQHQEDEEDEFEENEEDKHPGKISLNDGEHAKPYLIKKRIVNTGIVACALVVLVAWYYNSENNKAVENNVAKPVLNEAAADPNAANRRNRTPSTYEELFGSNQQARQGQNGALPTQGNNPRAGTGNNMTSNTAGTSAYQNRQQPTTPVPTQAFSAPYALPSMLYNQAPAAQPAAVPVQSAEEQEAKAVEDRYKSAIAFALGTGAGSGRTAPASKGAVDGGNTAGTTGGNAPDTSFAYAAPSATALQAGTLIPVMLFSGINTDAAGQVTAQVESDVYDSATGSNLLIPAGSRLIGTYEAGKASSSGRVGVTFSTIVLPDGGSYSVGSSLIAVDTAGYSGIPGKVNRHTGQVLSGGMLSSALAALGSYASGNTSATSNTYTGGQLAMQGAMANLMNSASKLFEKNSNVAATVTVEPGYEFNVYVTQPISFSF